MVNTCEWLGGNTESKEPFLEMHVKGGWKMRQVDGGEASQLFIQKSGEQ